MIPTKLASIFLVAGLLAFPLPAVAAGSEEPAGEAPDARGAISGERYIELDALTVTIFRNDAPAGQVTTSIVLMLEKSPDARATVTAGQVKLRDAMLHELHRLLEREAHNGPKVDLDLVKVRMLKITRRELGPDIVADLFVQAFLRRGA